MNWERPVYQSPPNPRKRGGRRRGAGRKRLATPIKKARNESKKQRRTLTRVRVRAKYDKVIQQLAALQDSGLTNTERYRKLSEKLATLSRYLNTARKGDNTQQGLQDDPGTINEDDDVAAILNESEGSDDEVKQVNFFQFVNR